MIARRQFLTAAGAAALAPATKPVVQALPAPAPRPLASNALALLRG
ncbi:hypothetical protein [Sphingomonas azotifigens]|nr:hypothetical protein [Sphingomonas azotifigens]